MEARKRGRPASEFPREVRRNARNNRTAFGNWMKDAAWRLRDLPPQRAAKLRTNDSGDLILTTQMEIAAAMGMGVTTLCDAVRYDPELRELICPNGRYRVRLADVYIAWNIHHARATGNMRRPQHPTN